MGLAATRRLSRNYGHIDPVIGRRAREEVYPLITDWLRPLRQPRYPGRMLALSVDTTSDLIDDCFVARGAPSFELAWAGGADLRELGIGGIPAMFVFDAEHRLVSELSGWGPRSRKLDRAIERILEAPAPAPDQ